MILAKSENILKVSVSNVLKKIIVSIGSRAAVIFQSYKPNGSKNTLYCRN